MRKPHKALVLTALVATGGCYTMTPTPARTIEPGTDVRVHLNETEDVELSSVTVRNVDRVEGQLTRWTSDDNAVIFTTRVHTRPGVTQMTQGEMVSIAEQNIGTMDAPQFSGARTAVAVAVGVGFVSLVVAAIASSGNKGSQPGDGDGDQPIVTFLKVPFGLR